MSAPNVIPMADIMLVLLIIFMVVTPMLQKGLSVEMAKVNNPTDMPNADKDDAVIVGISRERGRLSWQRQDGRFARSPIRCGTVSPTSWTRPCSSRATVAPSTAMWSRSWTKFAPRASITSACLPTSSNRVADRSATASRLVLREARAWTSLPGFVSLIHPSR